MGRSTVVRGLLICAAISVTGCWMERDAQGRVRIYGPGEFRARERYLERTQPERIAQMRRQRNTGICLEVIGGAGAACGLVYFMASLSGNSTSEEDALVASLMLGGGIAYLVGLGMEGAYAPYVRQEGRRRQGELLIGPRGCALVYRF